MALNFPSVPLSPGSQALMTLFTTINDTDPQPNEIDNTHLSKSVTLSTSLVPQPNLARRGALEGSDTTIAHEAEGEPQIRDSVPNKRISRAPKRRSMAATFQQQRLPGYICFSSTSGELVNGSKRSTFPQKRREEVKRVRERGACLRCQIRKISCSEGDPCRECLSLLQAKMGSKALMWMECIRLTIPELSPFERDGGEFESQNILICHILEGLQCHDVLLDFKVPFAMNIKETAESLASWLTDDSSASSFSIVGLLSSSGFTKVLNQAFSEQISQDVRLLVQLTSHLFTDGIHAKFGNHTVKEIELVRDYVGRRVLVAANAFLAPQKLKVIRKEPRMLRGAFLLAFSIAVALGYTIGADVNLNSATPAHIQGPHETLLRLLCYYIIHIGQSSGLMQKGVKEEFLVREAKTQWNKKAQYAWLPPPTVTAESSNLSSNVMIPHSPHTVSSEADISGPIKLDPLKGSGCSYCEMELPWRFFDEPGNFLSDETYPRMSQNAEALPELHLNASFSRLEEGSTHLHVDSSTSFAEGSGDIELGYTEFLHPVPDLWGLSENFGTEVYTETSHILAGGFNLGEYTDEENNNKAQEEPCWVFSGGHRLLI